MIRPLSFRLTLAALLATAAAPAAAQDAAPPPPARRTVDGDKILQLLVAKGVITQGDADGILAEAATASPPVVAGGVQGDTQVVPYIPETVRDQIKAQVVAEMAKKGETEGWARPGEVAEWTKRISLYGDIRVRGEGIFYGDGNSPSLVDYFAINTGNPFDTLSANPNTSLPPFLNSTENRNRARIRVRLGMDARITDRITAQVRLATGADNSPISTNQTLGAGTGDFAKYGIWLDRASLRFDVVKGIDITAGRSANPFWTSELLFDEDLNFDGASVGGSAPFGDDLTLFSRVGGFPVFNTALNFGSNRVAAFKSRDRWLLAGQVGAEWRAADTLTVKGAAGIFVFTRARGRLSSPCFETQDVCDTDNTRPLFLQFGNSVTPIRNNVPDPLSDPSQRSDPQYFGLASDFRVANAHVLATFNPDAKLPVSLEADYIRNLAFNRRRVARLQSNVIGPYDPGGTGWWADVRVGRANPGKWGEWTAFGGYRRIETDAMIDAFTDSDFHLGGTDAKGYIIGGAFGIGGKTAIGARFLSADEVTGAPYGVDVLQIDLTAAF